jgi:cytochrome c oxidase assembly protein subunit 15
MFNRIDAPIKRLNHLTTAAILLVSVVIGLGALTRLLDAGLGCPDWPGCYGFLTPPESESALSLAQQTYPDTPVIHHQAWMEMIHRYAASTLGFLILVMTVFVYRASHLNKLVDQQAKTLKLLTTVLLLLVIIQGAFGAWTVTMKLWPPIVTLHLLGGFSTLALLVILKLWLQRTQKNPEQHPPNQRISQSTLRKLRILGGVSLLAVFLQVTLGAWTSSNYAGLACPDFPTCQNQWLNHISVEKALSIPAYEGMSFLHGRADAITRVSIQVIHRLGALLVILCVAAYLITLWRFGHKREKTQALIINCVLSVQVLLGILAATLQLPLSIALLHNLIAALLVATLISSYAPLFLRVPLTSIQAASIQTKPKHNAPPLYVTTRKESTYGQ